MNANQMTTKMPPKMLPKIMLPKTFMATGILAFTMAASAADAPPANAATDQVEQQIDSLSQQLQQLKAQLQQLKSQNEALAEQQAAAPAQTSAASSPKSSPFDNLSLWGYGEVYYNRPIHDIRETQADLARAVFGIGYRFDDHTHFNSEFEVEHAVSSASDVGEFEVEQFYVDHQFTDWASIEGGLFLMPFGLLNEHHEPTQFYGVQRNFVETLIIPSTWREGGFAFHGNTNIGVTYAAGLTTGIDLGKWDFAPEYPPYATALELEDNDVAPLQATHQELALANAEHLAEFLSLSYNGLPGLTVGGAVLTENAAPVPSPPNAQLTGHDRVTLGEVHTRWTPGKFDLSALYARGIISNTGGANLQNPGSPNPIPAKFYGYYFQGAYTVWQNATYRISPFVRFERYDMGAGYEGTQPDIPSGQVPLSGTPGDYGTYPLANDRIWTYGANFYVTPHVVLKADYQTFEVNRDFTRFDLGLGLYF